MKTRRVIVSIMQSGRTDKNAQVQFMYPDTNITFRVVSDSEEEPASCLITISGVSRDTYMIFDTEQNKKYFGTQRVEVKYGYDDEMSLVFTGTVDRAIYSFDNGKQTLTLLVTRNKRKFNKQIKSISVVGKQSLKSVLGIIAKEYGYKLTFGKGDFDSISAGRCAFTGTIRDILKEVLPKDYGYYITETDLYVYYVDKSVPSEMTIWYENGLLAYPTEDSKHENTTIEMILIPNMEVGMKIRIPVMNGWYAQTDTGSYKTYVVKNFSSDFMNGLGKTHVTCEGGLGL